MSLTVHPALAGLDDLNASRGALAAAMGIVFVAAGPDHLSATMPVAGNTQPYGLLHGGASAVLAETVGSVLSAIVAGPGKIPAGMTINAIHHRPVAGGQVCAEGAVVAAGRTTVTTRITITDERSALVCSATLMCRLLDALPGTGPSHVSCTTSEGNSPE